MMKEPTHTPVIPAGKSESSTQIFKLVYKHEQKDCLQRKLCFKIVYSITPDGKLTVKEYRNGSRKAQLVNEYHFLSEEYEGLCKRIEECIERADRLDLYMDDASEELKIFYRYGRVQTMDRGLGNEDVQICEIIHDFLVGVMQVEDFNERTEGNQK